MPARLQWQGYIKLSLVTCPIAMMPAVTDSERIKFHTLDRETGERVESRYLDAVTGAPVEPDDQVRGFETAPNEFVIVQDEDLEAVGLDSARTIEIETFVPHETITWIWLNAAYYVVPSDPVGEEAFSVIRDAMKDAGMVGISRVALQRRERAVVIEPRDKGIMLWTLRYGDEVRNAKDYFSSLMDVKPTPELVALAEQLIDEKTEHWSPSMVEDPLQKQLERLIASRKKLQLAKHPKAPGTRAPGNVVNLFEELRKSLKADAPRPKHQGPSKT